MSGKGMSDGAHSGSGPLLFASANQSRPGIRGFLHSLGRPIGSGRGNAYVGNRPSGAGSVVGTFVAGGGPRVEPGRWTGLYYQEAAQPRAEAFVVEV